MAKSIKNIIAAVLIAISGFILLVGVLPKYNFSTVLENAILERETILAARQKIVEHTLELNKEMSGKYGEIQRLLLVAPDKKGLPEILTALEEIIASTGNSVSSSAVSNERSKEGEDYYSINIKIEGKGTYSAVKSMIGYLEKNIRLADINEVGLSKDDKSGESESNIVGLNFAISLIMYSVNPNIIDSSASE